jgi:hypothetical protein
VSESQVLRMQVHWKAKEGFWDADFVLHRWRRHFSGERKATASMDRVMLQLGSVEIEVQSAGAEDALPAAGAAEVAKA